MYSLVYHAIKLHIYIFHESWKKKHHITQCKSTMNTSRISWRNPALFEVQWYVFDSLLKHHLTKDNFFALIRSLENPERFAAGIFGWPLNSFKGPRLTHITFAKGSLTVLYNMIFDCCESGWYLLRYDGSRAVTIIWYEACFIRSFV